jgi:hypothetical protein
MKRADESLRASLNEAHDYKESGVWSLDFVVVIPKQTRSS